MTFVLLFGGLLSFSASAQEPAGGEPPATTPTPVPVIPEVLPNQPPATVPSAPGRVLPSQPVGVVPTATFQLQPSITLSEEYTDNFNLTQADKQSNFRSTVSPGLSLLINTPLTKGTITYSFSPAHDTATDEVSFFHSLLGQVVWQANPRWTLTLADTLTRSDQPGEADRLGLRQERRVFTSNTASLTSDYLVGTVATRQSYLISMFSDDGGSETTSQRLAASATVPLYQIHSFTAGYEYLSSESSGGTGTSSSSTGLRASSTASETSGHQLTVSALRQLTSLRSVGVKTSYAVRTLSDDTGDTDFHVWNASLFTDFVLPGRLALRGSLGVTGLTTDSGETLGPNLSSLTSLTYEFGRALMTLAVDRGFSETFASGQNFGVVETEGIKASLVYPFTPLLSGTVSGDYRRNKSTGIGGDASSNRPETGNKRTETWGGTVGFFLQLRPGLLFDLSYSYLRHDDGQVATGTSQAGGGNSYTVNRVKASIKLTF